MGDRDKTGRFIKGNTAGSQQKVLPLNIRKELKSNRNKFLVAIMKFQNMPYGDMVDLFNEKKYTLTNLEIVAVQFWKLFTEDPSPQRINLYLKMHGLNLDKIVGIDDSDEDEVDENGNVPAQQPRLQLTKQEKVKMLKIALKEVQDEQDSD